MYCMVYLVFKANFSTLQNDPIYSFLKSDLIHSSVCTALVINVLISSVHERRYNSFWLYFNTQNWSINNRPDCRQQRGQTEGPLWSQQRCWIEDYNILVVAPCSSEELYRRFRGIYRFHLQDWEESAMQAVYSRFLSWLTHRTWRWMRHVPPKRR